MSKQILPFQIGITLIFSVASLIIYFIETSSFLIVIFQIIMIEDFNAALEWKHAHLGKKTRPSRSI